MEMTWMVIVISIIVAGAALVRTQRPVEIVLLQDRSLRKENCEKSDSGALQRETAAQWAAEIICNQTQPRDFQLTIRGVDTCKDPALALAQILHMASDNEMGNYTTPLLGVVGLGDPDILNQAAKLLRAQHVPLLVASPRAAEMLLHTQQQQTNITNNVFSAAPNVASISRATLAVAKGLKKAHLHILSSCPHAISEAETAAEKLDLSILSTQLVKADQNWTTILSRFSSTPEDTCVAILLEPDDVRLIMPAFMEASSDSSVCWLLGSLGSLDNKEMAEWSLAINTHCFVIEPHMPELAGLANYLEERGMPGPNRNAEIAHVVQAVSALGAAFHLMELTCQSNAGSDGSHCSDLNHHLPQHVLKSLTQLSLPSNNPGKSASSPRELEGTSLRFTPSGRLVTNRYLVKRLSAATGDVQPVAWYSDDEGLVLAAMTGYTNQGRWFFSQFNSPALSPVQPFAFNEEVVVIEESTEMSTNNLSEETTVAANVTSTTSSGTSLETTSQPHVPKLSITVPLPTPGFAFSLSPSLVPTARHVIPELLMSRTWAAAIVAIAATGVLGAIYILVFVGVRFYDGTLSGTPQGMCLILLLGVIMELSSITLYVLPPNYMICQLKLFIPPLSLALCHGTMLMKLMHLRGLVVAGLGGSVPQSPLYLTLLFVMAVQAGLSGHFVNAADDDCSLPRSHLPLLYLYIFILVTVTTCYAVYLRHVRRNHREAQWILINSLGATVLMLTWGLVVSLAPLEYRDTATCSLLTLLGWLSIAVIFTPKMITLARLQKKQVTVARPDSSFISNALKNQDILKSTPSRYLSPAELSCHQLTRHPHYSGRM